MTNQVKELLGVKKPTREEFLANRKSMIGGSDIASVIGAGDFACARRLGYDKLEFPPDFDSSDKAEFRRGNRLEPVAVAYYQEKFPEHTVREAPTVRVKDKPHLGVNMDRRVQIPGREGEGYMEVKVAGKFSFMLIKKEGLYEAYISQLQYGMGVSGLSYGVFVIYCPDEDELLTWVVEADSELGEKLLEEADDFWCMNIIGRVLPPPLPEIKKVCIGCDFRVTCRGKDDLSEFVEKKPRKKKGEK